MRKTEQVRIAIVGCGSITESGHLPAALRSPAVKVSALVDININNAKRVRQRYMLDCVIEDDLNAVVSQVDGVLIATPNHTHFTLAALALDHNVPVLIEKPMTTSYADAMTLCELARQKSTFISVGYVTRFYPSVILMKALLDRRYFGKIRSFHYEFGSKGGWEPISGYNLHRYMAGGGVLINTGTHFLDRMLYWLGAPHSFSYSDDSYGGVEANCKAELLFTNGQTNFSGTLFLSKAIRLRNKFILDTDTYLCQLEEQQTESITLFPKSNPALKIELSPNSNNAKSGDRSYYQQQLEVFADNIRNGTEPPVDGWFAARSVKLIEDMYSHRSQLDESWLMYKRKIQSNYV